jgi:hypothetical protein
MLLHILLECGEYHDYHLWWLGGDKALRYNKDEWDGEKLSNT